MYMLKQSECRNLKSRLPGLLQWAHGITKLLVATVGGVFPASPVNCVNPYIAWS
jgi:hypothetical protein